ncbi:hypothetical protein FB451DRAFT_1379289 [Mycena latifolia]|nr:hypothetical protein FB451DRAFT_1379289 [Mycena latifolia]
MSLQPSQDQTNTVLRVIQESPHLFLDDIQQELWTSHGLMLSLPQISSIMNSTEMPHKQLATEQADEQESSKIAERKRKPVWFSRVSRSSFPRTLTAVSICEIGCWLKLPRVSIREKSGLC